MGFYSYFGFLHNKVCKFVLFYYHLQIFAPFMLRKFFFDIKRLFVKIEETCAVTDMSFLLNKRFCNFTLFKNKNKTLDVKYLAKGCVKWWSCRHPDLSNFFESSYKYKIRGFVSYNYLHQYLCLLCVDVFWNSVQKLIFIKCLVFLESIFVSFIIEYLL